jgi:hypothetical protein
MYVVSTHTVARARLEGLILRSRAQKRVSARLDALCGVSKDGRRPVPPCFETHRSEELRCSSA